MIAKEPLGEVANSVRIKGHSMSEKQYGLMGLLPEWSHWITII